MTRRNRRLTVVLSGLAALGVAAALVLSAFSDSLVFFYGPTELIARQPSPDSRVRVGGLVETGSVKRDGQDAAVTFRVTDNTTAIPVVYRGVLPDLFREGQGVVAEGSLGPDGTFRASSVLAKHDENYMPPEVAEALKKSGEWHGPDARPAPEEAAR